MNLDKRAYYSDITSYISLIIGNEHKQNITSWSCNNIIIMSETVSFRACSQIIIVKCVMLKNYEEMKISTVNVMYTIHLITIKPAMLENEVEIHEQAC